MPKINPYGFDFQGPPPREARIITNSMHLINIVEGWMVYHKGNWICSKCENVKFVFITEMPHFILKSKSTLSYFGQI